MAEIFRQKQTTRKKKDHQNSNIWCQVKYQLSKKRIKRNSKTDATIDATDDSKKLVCAENYARFLKKDETCSCQLVFSRSETIPDGLVQPRTELFVSHEYKYWWDSQKSQPK